jgi:hypothetical protein
MNDDTIIADLRKQSIYTPRPRDLWEWDIPVKPSDLRHLLEKYDALVAAENEHSKLEMPDSFDEDAYLKKIRRQ